MNLTPTLPALLESYFRQRLMAQRQASPHTIASYRDTFRLLLNFAQKQYGKSPSSLNLTDLDAPLISTFLDFFGEATQYLNQQSQCAADSHPLFLPLCRLRRARTVRAYSACLGHPEQASGTPDD